MKLVIQYWSSDGLKMVEAEPICIHRYQVGQRGVAKNRYRYFAVCKAPEDSIGHYHGKIKCMINRKANPKFNPKNYEFIGNEARCNE